MASAATWQTANFDGMQYLTLLPDGYVAGRQYPVLLFLHGGGEENQVQSMIDPWFNTPQFRAAYPAIVVAPILPQSSLGVNWGGYANGDSSGEQQALAITQHVVSQFGADQNRVYVTGLSLGGHGSWDLMIKDNAYDGTQGRVFAAALPLAGFESAPGYSILSSDNFSSIPTQAVVDELRGVPIWAVEGGTDYPGFDRAMAADLPNSTYRYTELPLGHDVWDTTYPLPNGKPYYDWLFSQSANLQTTPTVPIAPSPALAQEQQVARLYIAAFGRAADDGGLIANTQGLQAGLNLAQLGDAFVASPEFIAHDGTPSNAAFVEALYHNVLGRGSDAAGAQGWQAALQSGTSRGTVMAAFSDSDEAKQRFPATDAVTYAATAPAQVVRLYDTAFGRVPDATGGPAFTAAIAAGTPLSQIGSVFLGSAEFAARYGAALSNQALVDLLYANALHRPPDLAGESGYVAALQSGGLSRSDLFVAFSESPEHVALTAHIIPTT